MYKKILLATDGSDNSLKAAERVAELQKVWNAKIIIYHAEKHYFPTESSNRPRGFPFFVVQPGFTQVQQTIEMQKQFKIWGEQMLQKTKKIFDDAGIDVETRLEEDLDPAKYAEKVVKEEGIDLVVAGCKGHHSKLRKVFLGTVAEDISNKVSCDVLIVR